MSVLLLACNRVDDSPPLFIPKEQDRLPPEFGEEPKVEGITSHSAVISLSIKEQGLGYSVVSRKSLSLNSDQVIANLQKNPSHQSFTLLASTRTQILIGELEPDTQYNVYIAVEDALHNRLPKPKVLSFKTEALKKNLLISGEPLEAYQDLPWKFRPVISPSDKSARLESGPGWLRFNKRTFEVSGIPDDLAYDQGYFEFTLSSDEVEWNGSQTFKVKVLGDPLKKHAWHFANRGQTNFAWFPGLSEYDINLAPAYQKGLTGRDIRILIVDTGLQIDHPDLKANIDKNLLLNFDVWSQGGCQVCEGFDTTPPLKPGAIGDRGTSVAGLIAAEGWNGIGSRGIAPRAKIGAHNLAAPRIKPQEFFYLEHVNVNADIVYQGFNVSEEGRKSNLKQSPLYDTRQQESVQRGRNGRGVYYVKAAGDGQGWMDDANLDPFSSLPWTTVVGAFNASGTKSSFGNSGANLWLSAPGGEKGFQSEYSKIIDPGAKVDFSPGLMAPDLTAKDAPCTVGFAKNPTYFLQINEKFEAASKFFSMGETSGFNLGWHEQNPKCEYASSIHGTAAAAGIVAGIAALLLEENPLLTWRDIKHILAKTARQFDAKASSEVVMIAGKPFERQQAWITNGAGFKFHNSYGFGAVDAAAAIKMAEPASYQSRPPLMVSGWRASLMSPQTIPAHDIFGVQSNYTENDSFFVETVQVKMQVTHEDTSHLGVELVSPSGTKSILLPVINGSHYQNFTDMVFLSNAFYGEPANGEWRIKVIDGKGGRKNGQFINWAIQFTGYQ